MSGTGELKHVLLERRGRLSIVTINRPQVRNALNPEANAELAQVFDQFQADPEQWVAIVTGAGERAFCAGVDLRAIGAGGTRSLPKSGFAGLTGRYELDKPVIAAVNGPAVGGGLELVLACDIVIAAEGAAFGLLEPRIGTAALAGGLQRLGRQIGLKRAMDMILTAQTIDAARAQEYGLINEVVPLERLMPVALARAERILELAPLAVRASKQAVLQGMAHSSIEAAVAAQRDMPAVKTLLKSADRKEGARAFAERRPPVWHGR
jgi:crotonobetainyl-CoA hydratase